MIDTHCHIYKEYYEDVEKIINDAYDAGVTKLIVSGCSKEGNIEAFELSGKYDNVYATLGYDPSSVDDLTDEDMNNLERMLQSKKVVGIGECGLDYYYTKDNMEKQKSIFRKHIELAIKYNLPLVIHSREACDDTYKILKEYNNIRGVIHCYSYKLEYALKFIKLNFLIGVGGVVTYKNAKTLVDVVENIDIKHIVLETDAPYLTPQNFRKYKNEPKYLTEVAKRIAEIKNMDYKDVLEHTINNTYNIYNIR